MLQLMRNTMRTEQLFVSVGVLSEALLEFFQTSDVKCKPTANGPNPIVLTKIIVKVTLTALWISSLTKYVFHSNNERNVPSDGVWCYGINIHKSYLLLADIKDAVATGNGHHLNILHKQLLKHFFTTTGFNEFSIEMLINILQCNVLLSEAEAH